MDTLTCVKSRRSVRRFRPEAVSQETIHEIIDCARFAPSWANTKVPRFLYTADAVYRGLVRDCCSEHNKRIVSAAPGLFLVTAVVGRSGIERDGTCPYPSHTPKEWLMLDCGLAIQNLCLGAWDLGVGTVILGGYDLDQMASLLPIPENEVLVAVVAAGYPDEEPPVPRRNEVEKILRVL